MRPMPDTWQDVSQEALTCARDTPEGWNRWATLRSLLEVPQQSSKRTKMQMIMFKCA